MEWWQTLLVGLAGGAVPVVLLWVLNRNGANKKLDLEQGALEVTTFEAQLKAFQALLDAANKTTDAYKQELEAYKTERESLVETVSQQGQDIEKTNDKLDKLRALFTSYIARTDIPLTAEEQEIFEYTVPTSRFRRTMKEGKTT